jgi:uncharacterized protein YcfL
MKALLKLIPLVALTGLVACSAAGVRNGDLSGATRAVGDSDIDGIIKFGQERISFSRSDFAVYQVELINEDDDDVRVEYQAYWYDADGIEVPSVVRSWRPVFIAAGDHHSIRSSAPNMEAVRCEMKVQLSHPMTR